VLVGINLLREGLDLPEVSLVAILDADKAGFLRSETSLIQTIGRAARNVNSKVVLYADSITPAMKAAMDETERRRVLQTKFNADNGITPATIKKAIRGSLESEIKARKTVQEAVKANEQQMDQTELVKLLEDEMLQAAQNLEFERAAQLRDKINELKGSPVIRSGNELITTESGEQQKVWRPKQQGRGGGKRKIAK
jgi:excinuclease ABC subunit B